MIAVERRAAPPSVDGETSAGGRERAKAVAFFAEPANQSQSFPFKAFKADDVKRALEELFGGKCAYCETYYAAGAPVDVEHYRPKGEIKCDHGPPIKPGYYWLAADWNNLLPSCIDCNRARRQELAGGEALSGKASWFPLIDESKRASAPGGEQDEEPYLLDPCRDDPSRHLEFIEDGGLRAAEVGGAPSPRGERSIEILGLDRSRLAQARRSHAIVVERALVHFRHAVQRLELDPNDKNAIEGVAFELEELERLRDRTAPYAAMARQRIDPVLAAYVPQRRRG